MLSRREGRVTAEPQLRHPYGIQELAIARRLAAAAGTDLASAWAYGDAWADRFLLGGVGHPVAVRPGRRLRRFAVMSGWEMIDADAA